MVELIDLIKDKKYEEYKDIYEIEKYKFKYPKSWEVSLTEIEKDIINFFFFKNDELPNYNSNNNKIHQYENTKKKNITTI